MGLLLALALVGACRTEPERAVSRVLVVTIDGLRGDEPAFAGGAPGVTPNLERLAGQGTAFLRAYAAAPLDQPSRATLLTGLSPASHGVRDDGDFVLADGVDTLAGRLARDGWTTVAVSSSWFADRRFGLDRGFTHRFDATDLEALGNDPAEVSDAELAQAAVGWFARPGPLFVWVDLAGPHWPWTLPGADPRAAELAAADAALGVLLAAWDDAGAGPDLVVVASPHGESLGEGGERTHGLLLHDPTLRVPLVVRGPGFRSGQAVSDPVGLVDVAPTVLRLAGLSGDGLGGRDLAEGGSVELLSESLAGQTLFGLAPLVASTDVDGRTVRGAWTTRHPARGDRISAEGARTDDPGLLAHLEAALAAVPVVPVAQAALEPELVERLATLGYVGGDALATPGSRDPRDAMDVLPLEMQARRYLRDGLTGRAAGALSELDRRLPEGFGAAFTEARLAWQQGRAAEAEAAWSALAERTPSGTVALQLAAVCAAQDRWDEARLRYEEAARLDPTSLEAVAGRLRALRRQGDADLADDLALRWLAAHDDHGELAPGRAEWLLDQGDLAAAAEEAARGVRGQPWSAWARSASGRVSYEQGFPDRAIAELEEAVRLDPHTSEFRARLAGWYLELGRPLDAVRVLAPVARTSRSAEVRALDERARGSVTEDDKVRQRIDRAHTFR